MQVEPLSGRARDDVDPTERFDPGRPVPHGKQVTFVSFFRFVLQLDE